MEFSEKSQIEIDYDYIILMAKNILKDKELKGKELIIHEQMLLIDKEKKYIDNIKTNYDILNKFHLNAIKLAKERIKISKIALVFLEKI